ncbi:DUF6273 domain-containing protein [Anaerocolumna sp. MB42-C2]|uniref:DUF6273 domain-containing protein n=1 Tax=Anaerocolumna sp. MB42-C2 TaxID=3070997 RepID=UPI0027E152B0|nr:DUF6273 domain-containing protein [Anaerocolumna sp. MB42-C2]WMJ87013.1 DUF6273 domain-containing protein [Anaerocolumna sp. MB42-C2]
MTKKNNESVGKVTKEQKEDRKNIALSKENSKEDAEVLKDQNYQKLVSLMKSIRCMPGSNSKIDMYRQVADKFTEFSGYCDADEYSEDCRRLAKKTEEEIKKSIYENAHNRKKNAKQTLDYKIAADEFREISGYLDSDDMILECEQLTQSAETRKSRKKLAGYGAAVLLILAFLVGINTSHAKYYLANTFMYTHSYKMAINLYTKLGPYKDCDNRLIESQYQNGLIAESDGNYENARYAYAAAGDYKDSEERKVNMEKLLVKNSGVGKFVTIGNCKWEVLDIRNDQVLLLKKTALREMAYNDNAVDVTWESSSIRKWLNSDFLNETFSELEQKNMVVSDVINNDNEVYGTDGGNDTKDYVFLLSIEEADKYKSLFPVFKNNGWLRSPGYNQGSAAFISVSGNIMDYGYAATAENEFTVRPAYWFNLK